MYREEILSRNNVFVADLNRVVFLLQLIRSGFILCLFRWHGRIGPLP